MHRDPTGRDDAPIRSKANRPGQAWADRLRGRWLAFYAVRLYLPCSTLARSLRRRTRALRGYHDRNRPTGRLQTVSWRRVMGCKPTYLIDPEKRKGNVSLSELALLGKAAALVPGGQEIVEIGTFDGRSTLNLALNSSPTVPVFTLDLPATTETRFALPEWEREYVGYSMPGARFRGCAAAWRESAARIVQDWGDSATYDWSAHEGNAGLVFVDGAHSYEYALSDSEVAFRLAAPGAMIIWHDYGTWSGVTQALDELEAARGLGLRRLQGTSLVFWRRK